MIPEITPQLAYSQGFAALLGNLVRGVAAKSVNLCDKSCEWIGKFFFGTISLFQIQ